MKIFAIPVKVEASFLIVLLMAMGRSSDLSLIVEWGVVVFFSILIHEMGHAFAGRAFGLEPRITLYAMGGLTSWSDGRREISPSQSIRISLAGPLSGLLLGGLIYLLKPFYTGDSFLVAMAISDLLWINLAWSLFSLLPILPMDGGRILESLEEWWRGKGKNSASTIFSIAVAGAVAVWALAGGYAWIAFLSAWFLWSNASTLIGRIRLHFDQPLQEKLKLAREELEAENGKALIELSEAVLAKAKTERLRSEALELLIYGHIFEKDFAQAHKCLHQYKALFGANLYTEGYLLYCQGESEAAVKILQTAFENDPSRRTGDILFHALLKTDRPQEVLQLCAHPVFEGRSVDFYLSMQAELFEQGQPELAAQLGMQVFDKTKYPAIAYNIGCAFALQHNLQKAYQWVLCAVQSGFSDRTLIESDTDIAEIRNLPEFERIYQILAEQAEVAV